MDFFILGNPRSGTTLLRLMLNKHSQIGVPPESGFMHWWHEKYGHWSIEDSANNSRVDGFLGDLLQSKKIEGWNMKAPELKEFIVSQSPKTYSELIDCVYRYYTKEKTLIGDKNNYYIHHLEDIKAIMPQAKYIHIVRDGRDVACSYIDIQKLDQNMEYLPKLPSAIEDIANEWNDNINRIETFLLQQTSITIRYEDLLLSTQSTLEKICAFLGVNFEGNMLNYHMDNNEPDATMHWKKKTKQPVDTSNINRFVKNLSTQEQDAFIRIAKANLGKFGYLT